jgi:hypothetical protein
MGGMMPKTQSVQNVTEYRAGVSSQSKSMPQEAAVIRHMINVRMINAAVVPT